MGCQEGSRVAWVAKSRVLSISFLVFWCFDIKKPAASSGCTLLSLEEVKEERGALEAWGDPGCSGDSNTVAITKRLDFPKKKLPHQCPGWALGTPGWWGMASPGYRAQEPLLELEPRWPW